MIAEVDFLMKIIILGDFGSGSTNGYERLAKNLSTQLTQEYPDLATEVWSLADKKVTNPAIQAAAPDLLVTFDLAGFTFTTLTGGVAFNLLNCKQVHFLLEDRLPNEKYLAEPLSISMFFYCLNEEYCARLKEQYPELPFLDIIPLSKETAEDMNAAVPDMIAAIRETVTKCHIPL